MIRDVMCAMAVAVEETGYFKEVFPLTEFLERGEIKAPAFYTNNGQLEYVHQHDLKGVGYFRKTGKINVSLNSEASTNSCDGNDFIIVALPVRLVASVLKSKLEDNAFSDDKLALELVAAVQGSVDVAINAQSVSCSVTGWETDDYIIWSEEVEGSDAIINKELSYVAVDMSITISVNKDCLVDVCYG